MLCSAPQIFQTDFTSAGCKNVAITQKRSLSCSVYFWWWLSYFRPAHSFSSSHCSFARLESYVEEYEQPLCQFRRFRNAVPQQRMLSDTGSRKVLESPGTRFIPIFWCAKTFVSWFQVLHTMAWVQFDSIHEDMLGANSIQPYSTKLWANKNSNIAPSWPMHN